MRTDLQKIIIKISLCHEKMDNQANQIQQQGQVSLTSLKKSIDQASTESQAIKDEIKKMKTEILQIKNDIKTIIG